MRLSLTRHTNCAVRRRETKIYLTPCWMSIDTFILGRPDRAHNTYAEEQPTASTHVVLGSTKKIQNAGEQAATATMSSSTENPLVSGTLIALWGCLSLADLIL